MPAGPLKNESPMISADMGIAITPCNFPSHSALDVVALTPPPAPFHGSPAELPDDYYFWPYRHMQSSDEVL